jgi:hypothetical protein
MLHAKRISGAFTIEHCASGAHVSVHLCDCSARCRAQRDSGICRLLSDAQSVDDRPIARIVHVTKIVQQPATPSDELQQTTPGMVVLLMEFEVLRQIADPVRQDRDLDFRRTGIAVMLPVLLDQFGFRFFQ